MIKTVNLNADIPPNRELHITLPPDVPAGPADIVIVVSSSGSANASTLGKLGDSEFFGMWRERTDLGDSVQFARDLRSEGWKRSA
jgi:tRNA(fMet)-specific endonuclease VapC